MGNKNLIRCAKLSLNRYEANGQPGDLRDLIDLLTGGYVTENDLKITRQRRHELMHAHRIHQGRCLLSRLRSDSPNLTDWLLLQSFIGDHGVTVTDLKTDHEEIKKIRARFCANRP